MTYKITQLLKAYKLTELGVIPEDWDLTTLFKISVDGVSKDVFNDPTKAERGYRLVNVLDLYHGYSIDTKNLSRLELSQTHFTKSKIKKGDVFLQGPDSHLKKMGFNI